MIFIKDFNKYKQVFYDLIMEVHNQPLVDFRNFYFNIDSQLNSHKEYMIDIFYFDDEYIEDCHATLFLSEDGKTVTFKGGLRNVVKQIED